MTLVLLEVSLMSLILRISREIKWKLEVLMENIFMVPAYLTKLSTFSTNLFVCGTFSIKEVQWITIIMKAPIFPG